MDPFFEQQCQHVRVLYQNVKNTADIRRLVLSTGFPVCLVKPSLIVDDFQLSVAITKALYNQKELTMTTRSLQTEIIYCLSPTKNIKESLETFGSGPEDTEFILIGEEPSFLEIRDSIKGDRMDMKHIGQFTDVHTITKIYEIQHEELESSTLLDSVVSKMASKEYI